MINKNICSCRYIQSVDFSCSWLYRTWQKTVEVIKSHTWSHTLASGCQCLQAKHKVYVSKHHVSTFNVNLFWLWLVNHDNKYGKELFDCAVLPTFAEIDDGKELWLQHWNWKEGVILVQHINSVDCGLINSASIDGGSWASWRRVHFLVSCLLKFGKHYVILSLCIRKRDFNILDNVFIAFHQSNSKWDFFAWLIHLLVFMCFVTHFGNLWVGVHVTFPLKIYTKWLGVFFYSANKK